MARERSRAEWLRLIGVWLMLNPVILMTIGALATFVRGLFEGSTSREEETYVEPMSLDGFANWDDGDTVILIVVISILSLSVLLALLGLILWLTGVVMSWSHRQRPALHYRDTSPLSRGSDRSSVP